MTEADIIRSASSKWLRDHEADARSAIKHSVWATCRWDALRASFPEWSPWRLNNMLTYLAMVDGDE